MLSSSSCYCSKMAAIIIFLSQTLVGRKKTIGNPGSDICQYFRSQSHPLQFYMKSKKINLENKKKKPQFQKNINKSESK